MRAVSGFRQETGFQSPRIPAVMAIGVGVLLWYLPALLLSVFEQPIVQILHITGLLAPTTGEADARFAAGLALRWVAVAALVAFVLGVERLPLQSIGISTPRPTDVLWAVGAGMMATGVGIGLYLLVQGFRPGIETAAEQITDRPSLLGKIHLIVNAAIVEEVFFRGLLIERVTALTRRAWVGGVASWVVFVVSHIAGSGLTESLTIVGVSSLVFVLLYLWRRNLWVCIVAHIISNSPLLLS